MKKISILSLMLLGFSAASMADDTWTVAGTPASVFIDEWTPGETRNDMTLADDGNFYWKKSLTFTDETTVEFKIVKDHSSYIWPGDNYSWTVSAGKYDDAVIVFNGSDKGIAIADVALSGSWDSWEDRLILTRSEGLTYTGVLDLSTVTDDVEFKIRTNGGFNWIGSDMIMESSDLLEPSGSESTNMKLLNANSGFQTYDVTATYNLEDSKWELSITGKDVRIAEISSASFSWGVTGQDPWNNDNLTKADDSYTYTGVVYMSNVVANQEFKLRINDNIWLGQNEVTINAPEGWITDGANMGNITLNHATTHYLTYNITATWTPGPNAADGWTVNIAGKDPTPKNTYNVTFVNGKKWNEVYAYVWNGDGNTAEKLEGNWPGKKITATGATATYNGEALDIYSYTYEGYSAPEKIIFNNGKAEDAADKEQTSDLAFESNKQYIDAVVFVPVYVVVGSINGNDNDQAFFPAKWSDASTSTDVMTYDATSGKWMQSIPDIQIETPSSYKFKIAKRSYLESTDFTLYPEGSDITIEINEANTYDITITFDDTNNNVDKTVKAKYETFAVTAAGWATAKANNNVDFTGIDGLEAYTATVSGNYVTLKKEGAVPKGTALVLKGTFGSSVEKQVPIVANEAEVTNSLEWFENYDVTSTDTYAIYGLTASNGEAEFTRVNEGQKIQNKAILRLKKSLARELKVVFADEANGINAVTADQSVEGIFNLNGQRVEAPSKGLYIVNGKKVILK